ncbi:hypothetical protein Tsubulata_024773 [Turnera subulata]|uniref:Uncharacterized protein n=1 Tax=Turnera subulata TaxID=218843 RepID=A0A9Q0J5Y1_9ROSI|nr:hypothetical protein Tsubulata_024773 [Turnera subulata]
MVSPPVKFYSREGLSTKQMPCALSATLRSNPPPISFSIAPSPGRYGNVYAGGGVYLG